MGRAALEIALKVMRFFLVLLLIAKPPPIFVKKSNNMLLLFLTNIGGGLAINSNTRKKRMTFKAISKAALPNIHHPANQQLAAPKLN